MVKLYHGSNHTFVADCVSLVSEFYTNFKVFQVSELEQVIDFPTSYQNYENSGHSQVESNSYFYLDNQNFWTYPTVDLKDLPFQEFMSFNRFM